MCHFPFALLKSFRFSEDVYQMDFFVEMFETERRVTFFIHSYCSSRSIVTLHDLVQVGCLWLIPSPCLSLSPTLFQFSPHFSPSFPPLFSPSSPKDLCEHMERRTLHQLGFGSLSSFGRLPDIRRLFATPPHLSSIPPISTSAVVTELVEYSQKSNGRVVTSNVLQIYRFYFDLTCVP